MMFSTRFVSKNLLYTPKSTSQPGLPIGTSGRGTILQICIVCVILWIASGYNFLSAQQAQIAIVLPSVTPQTSEGDVQYARSVSKRLNRMLNSIGFTADTLEEASLSEGALQSRRLLMLPLNSAVNTQTTRLLKDFVAKGGKLFVTYNLPETVAPLLGLQQTDWLKDDPPGRFSTVQLRAPEILDIPTSVRQASWNITVAEPTTPQTKIIGYWHDATGKSTGLPALFINETGVFFSHIFLSDDIQAKTRLLAALLGHLVPEFRQTLAEQAIAAIPAIGHTETLEKLAQFVQQSGVQKAIQALKMGRDLMRQARAAYAAKDYNAAITTARTSRETFSEAYFLSHTSIETEGRAVWNHSGLGAYPGDWNRSAKELAAAGINTIFPNMAWAGVAHYPSQVLPQSKTFSQYGDQLAECVAAAQQHGLEVHVWKITWNLEGAPKRFVEKLREAGRTQVSATGEPLNWLCPSHPENVQLELRSLLEIITNYDVDGIHLDYIRYPGSHACYCEECRKRFVLATRQKIEKWPAAVLPRTGQHGERYIAWRTQQITRLVRLLHKRAREADPDIKISAAVFGSYPACVTSIGQDWIAWAKAGYIDFVCPMNYTENTDYFTELLINQLDLLPKGFTLYSGIGATASNSLLKPDAVVEQIYLSRYLGGSGWVIFDYSVDISGTVLPALAMGIAKRKAKPAH